MVVHPEHGTIDSPLHPNQVVLKPDARQAVAQLVKWGFSVSICTNQPTAAKGKTTYENVDKTHARVLALLKTPVKSSHICKHKAEDGCGCRKPRPGMLEDALSLGNYDRKNSWMVGDGLTDVQAGKAAGLKTAFLGSQRQDVSRVLEDNDAVPDLHLSNLGEFVRELGCLWGLDLPAFGSPNP